MYGEKIFWKKQRQHAKRIVLPVHFVSRNNLIDFIPHLDFASLTVQHVYSSSLSADNQVYFRDCEKVDFYYESIQVKVNKSGYFTFSSHSNIDLYGYLYRNNFNPLNPAENLHSRDDESGSGDQFGFQIDLTVDMTYILVVTTYDSKETGSFSISAWGRSDVIFKRLSK